MTATMIAITKRWSGEVIWSGKIASLRQAVMKAIEEKKPLQFADLRGAHLRDANLSAADLSGADLRDADLRGADLSDADLSDANLRDANLSDADLRGADLSDADLRDADLRDADLSGADLRGANLRDADLSGADLRDANLSGADLRGANEDPIEIPAIERIDAKILAACTAVGHSLDMNQFHVCETTHCRAGWAIHLAGEAGRKLEKAIGPNAAGALIYAKSRPGKPVPNFFALNEAAMQDMQECAKEQSQA